MKSLWRRLIARLFLKTYLTPTTEYVTTISGMTGRPIIIFEVVRRMSSQEYAQVEALARAKGFEVMICNGDLKFITVLVGSSVPYSTIKRANRTGYDDCGAPDGHEAH